MEQNRSQTTETSGNGYDNAVNALLNNQTSDITSPEMKTY